MDELEVVATFDTEETARLVAKSLNDWFSWIMEGDPDDHPDFFDDFGISTDEYLIDKETDVDWEDAPIAKAQGNRVMIFLESSASIDTIEELLEALGAYDVSHSEDED